MAARYHQDPGFSGSDRRRSSAGSARAVVLEAMSSPARDGAPDLAVHWTLDPNVTYLNHGAFGACRRTVLEVQTEWRARLEREPVRFFLSELEPRLDEVRTAAGELVKADPCDIVFVTNATQGVNTVLASFPFERGDEVLITEHGYNACNNAARYWTARAGAQVAGARVPFPVEQEDDVVQAVLEAVTPRKLLGLIDPVTSPTGLVVPIGRIGQALSE